MFLLLTLPWIGLVVFMLLRVRIPGGLPGSGVARVGAAPRVSIIVPARDEAANISRCVRSLVASTYPLFEVIVVDDRSTDDTAALARGVPPGTAERVEVVEGAELPEGWLGKPWACWQGMRRARGDLLLFTDADTVHGPQLLDRAVAEREREGADLLTLAGRQLMGSFWERLVQPHVFLMMLLRFRDLERGVRKGRWRDAIANGQFLLFTRDAYDALGGHEAVRDEVAEDLALAQLVVRRGLRLVPRMAEDDLATRMYRSLGELVRGWSKNLVMGGLQSMAPWLRPFVVPGTLLWIVGMWIVPPVLLALAAGGLASRALLPWAALVTVVSALFWAWMTAVMKAPARYGLLYPLGAAVLAYIFLRSWIAGRRIRWKGRSYRLKPLTERS